MADTSALEESKIFKRLADEKDLWWAVVSLDHSSGKPKPTVSAQGGTTIEDMMTHLSDEQLQFGCFKVLGVDTKGAIVSTRTKFVCFQWVGPKVSKIATSKAIPTKSAIFSYFQGHHLALEIYDRDSLSEADIEKRLRAAGGAHQPSEMQFPGGGRAVSTSDVVAAAGGGTPVATGGSSTPTASAAAAPASSSAAPAVLKAFGGASKLPAAVPAKAASVSGGSSASPESTPKVSESIAFAKAAAAEAAAAVASGDLASAAAAVAAVVAALEKC